MGDSDETSHHAFALLWSELLSSGAQSRTHVADHGIGTADASTDHFLRGRSTGGNRSRSNGRSFLRSCRDSNINNRGRSGGEYNNKLNKSHNIENLHKFVRKKIKRHILTRHWYRKGLTIVGRATGFHGSCKVLGFNPLRRT